MYLIPFRLQLWLARRNKNLDIYFTELLQKRLKKAVTKFIDEVDLEVKDIEFISTKETPKS